MPGASLMMRFFGRQSIKARMHRHPSQLQKMRLIAADLERFEIEATARTVAAGQDTIEHVNLRRRGDGRSP
jgi:hypothetical protein